MKKRKDEVFQSIKQIIKNIKEDKKSKNVTSYREMARIIKIQFRYN